MSKDLPEVYIVAIQTGQGYTIAETTKASWYRLSPTLREHRLVMHDVVYHVKAQTWVEDQALVAAIDVQLASDIPF